MKSGLSSPLREPSPGLLAQPVYLALRLDDELHEQHEHGYDDDEVAKPSFQLVAIKLAAEE